MVTLGINKMSNPNMQQTSLQLILQAIKDSLPMIGGIIAVWKTIDEIAKWYSKKQELRLQELIKAEVTPQIELLTNAINDLREEIGKLKVRS